MDTDKLENELRRRLLISTRDNLKAIPILNGAGFAASVLEGDLMAIDDAKAIMNPENIASLLVNAGCPPVMLKVDEEDLESYFLRVIGSNAESAG